MKDGNGVLASLIPVGLKIEIDPETDEPTVTPLDVKVRNIVKHGCNNLDLNLNLFRVLFLWR